MRKIPPVRPTGPLRHVSSFLCDRLKVKAMSSVAEIMAALPDLTRDNVNNALRYLYKRGFVDRTDETPYQYFFRDNMSGEEWEALSHLVLPDKPEPHPSVPTLFVATGAVSTRQFGKDQDIVDTQPFVRIIEAIDENDARAKLEISLDNSIEYEQSTTVRIDEISEVIR